MWLKNSSIGRKVVMSVTGIALVLFLTFHMGMNLVAVFSNPDYTDPLNNGYNQICHFLGANWYALVGTLGLAALFIIHIIYAIWLTIQNRKARGNERYDVVERRETVKWASQNMFVLGLIVVIGLGLHLFNFWYNMQFQEILGHETAVTAIGNVAVYDGYQFIKLAFANPIYTALYVVWLVALWFHLTHGFWSAIQTIGWSNDLWINRWKTISNIYSTIIVVCFLFVVVWFYVGSL
ncbi:succinate dehydrogenase (or fumarate reductase) cytochrome b subunit, b558 family [Bacteroides coprosuis DSM 18011]|uniref:Succinate dehydrogenase (Or fumarate reductase) cytochrome b subunit, b558 family n=1 Tax=Bacteroides coprosuis DSM 18011 TaxID=679937 RepID=F3ZR74_9BACE|nr:succinate dehydrogenase/fumarate reductase cytochrome b subunit [Bacteroides coprosuis]EGJ70667.1 succinate dehydrogenase (or fumarate reductase) cytochrome b subunit, b558 family [Bacteroides coprosuis DSM 18011]HJD92319.1 succinate dehydrogenase/fumarate reductase cytochrome b subunit [Bacteroides coprosuis]